MGPRDGLPDEPGLRRGAQGRVRDRHRRDVTLLDAVQHADGRRAARRARSTSAELCSTQPEIIVNGWVLLEDDKQTQPADNIAPIVRNDFLAKTDKAAFQKLLDDRVGQDRHGDARRPVQAGRASTRRTSRTWSRPGSRPRASSSNGLRTPVREPTAPRGPGRTRRGARAVTGLGSAHRVASGRRLRGQIASTIATRRPSVTSRIATWTSSPIANAASRSMPTDAAMVPRPPARRCHVPRSGRDRRREATPAASSAAWPIVSSTPTAWRGGREREHRHAQDALESSDRDSVRGRLATRSPSRSRASASRTRGQRSRNTRDARGARQAMRGDPDGKPRPAAP